MARIDCNKPNWLCLSTKCRKAKRCACNTCGELKAINPNLFDACIDACQEPPRPENADAYLCGTVGPEVLFNRFGVVMCGFDPYEETLEGQLFQQSETLKENENSFQQKLVIGLGAFLLILMLVLILD
jgi:hypothetical protein